MDALSRSYLRNGKFNRGSAQLKTSTSSSNNTALNTRLLFQLFQVVVFWDKAFTLRLADFTQSSNPIMIKPEHLKLPMWP